MKTAIFCFAVLVVVALASADQFDDWAVKHGKKYATLEETAHRRSVFFDNLKHVAAMNADLKAQGHDQVYNTTIFMDMTREEFKATHLNYVDKRVEHPTKSYDHSRDKASVDWRKHHVVTPVKNQGQCGSCWAFSATETVESFWALAGHHLTELSPQQVTSCTTGCDGCGGGLPYVAYEYLERAGLESAHAYPYRSGNGDTGRCEYNRHHVAAHVKGWSYVAQRGDWHSLRSAVSHDGPVSICVDASTWQFYHGGVLSSNCGQQLDHCVQLVGFKDDYWMVRNSWTASWGIEGYIHIKMGENLCGIANAATIVHV